MSDNSKLLIHETVSQLISYECDKVKELLLEKNKKYGNSALNPIRIFSKASPEDGINVRIDDKLSRISNELATNDEEKHNYAHKNDTILDLIGYLILLRVHSRMHNVDS